MSTLQDLQLSVNMKKPSEKLSVRDLQVLSIRVFVQCSSLVPKRHGISLSIKNRFIIVYRSDLDRGNTSIEFLHPVREASRPYRRLWSIEGGVYPFSDATTTPLSSALTRRNVCCDFDVLLHDSMFGKKYGTVSIHRYVRKLNLL